MAATPSIASISSFNFLCEFIKDRVLQMLGVTKHYINNNLGLYYFHYWRKANTVFTKYQILYLLSIDSNQALFGSYLNHLTLGMYIFGKSSVGLEFGMLV